MIRALDHVIVTATELAATRSAYEVLLGRAMDADNRCQTPNMAIVVEPATGAPGVHSAVFAADDFAATTRLIERRGIELTVDAQRATTTTHGLALGIIDRDEPPTVARDNAAAAILGLDHIVVHTVNPDRAVALFGARLGLDLRLDRTFAERSACQLFFRCGDLVVEIVVDLRKAGGDEDDRFWGLAWRARDAGAAHERLAGQGVEISELRTGRKKGTRVFTVKDRALGVPTLIIGSSRRDRRAHVRT